MRSIEDIKADLNDCQNCKSDRDCMGVMSNCEKPWNIEHYENEMLRALTANITLKRLSELVTAEREKGCDYCGLIYKLDGASYGTDSEIIENRFCPMCGKRLEVEP